MVQPQVQPITPPQQPHSLEPRPTQLNRPAEIPGIQPTTATRQIVRVRTLPTIARSTSFEPQIVYFEGAYWLALEDGSWGRIHTLK